MVMAGESDAKSNQGQADFPPGMAPKMLNMLKAVNNIEKELEPLISKPYHEVLRDLSPLEKAKVGMLEVYGINSLFWVLMKTSGEDIQPNLREDYKIETGRLKETQQRIALLELSKTKPHIDKEAAGRFVKRGLGKRTNDGEENGKHSRNPKKKK